MKGQEFIDALSLAKDIDIADITFYVGDKAYEVESMGQMGILTDISINLKEVEIPLIQPIGYFRRDKTEMIENIEKKIIADRNQKTLYISLYESHQTEFKRIKSVSGKTLAKERRIIINKFRKGEIKDLCVTKLIFVSGGIRWQDIDDENCINIVFSKKISQVEKHEILNKINLHHYKVI